MIRKLRKKFVVINMLLVTLVLLIVFGVLLYSGWQQRRNETLTAMGRLADFHDVGGLDPGGFKPNINPGGDGRGGLSVAVFSVLLNDDGSINEVNDENVVVSAETVQKAVDAVLSARGDATTGVINSLSLRYLKTVTPQGYTRLIFADRSGERAYLSNLLLTSLLIGVVGLGAFYLISLFLSRWALRPVEKSWEQQRRFVADASHELKTPITVILANSEILTAHPEQTVGAEKKWIDSTRDEAGRMKRMVEELLFLAKSEDNADRLHKQTLDYSELVTGCALPFESVAYEAGVSLETEVAAGIRVVGDGEQLRRMVMILLDNACKYAGRGGRAVLRLAAVSERAVLTVQNTGEPIPPERLEHVFERFYRADDSRTDTGSFGLGLAIAHQIADNHAGSLSVSSAAETGTVFTFALKRA